MRAEQTLVEQEWQRLRADRAPLDAERQRLRLAQEQLEAAIGRLDSDGAQLDADRIAFDRDLESRNADLQERERRLAEAEAATRQPLTAGETGPSADVATTSGDVADRRSEDATSRGAMPGTSPTEDGWLLDDFMAMNPFSAAGNSITESAPDADTSASESDGQAEALGSQITDPLLESDADSPNPHLYVQDLLHRMRSGRASEPFVHLPPEASPELTETDRSADAPDQTSAPEVEQDLLDSVNEIQDSVRSAVSPDARSRPDSVEIRAGLGSLRELANYSARTALAQHTWKKTKSELAMKVSFVVGALVTVGGMDYFLSNSPRYSKLSILPLGFALLVAGDPALSYFRARRMFAASSAAGEAWQVEDTLDKSDAPTADLTPDASTGQPVQYTFEYDGEPAADTESRADR